MAWVPINGCHQCINSRLPAFPFFFFFLFSCSYYSFFNSLYIPSWVVHELIEVKFVLNSNSTQVWGRTEPAIDQEGTAVWMARVPTNGHQMLVRVNKLKQHGQEIFAGFCQKTQDLRHIQFKISRSPLNMDKELARKGWKRGTIVRSTLTC